MQCVLLSYMRYIDDIFSATSDASMIFEGSGGFMFGDSAQGTGIFPTAVKKADGSIIEKPLELEGEGGSSVNYLDVTISIRRNRLRWTLYDKKKFIFIDGKALSESPNFPWYDSKLTERSKVGVVTSEMVRYSRRTDTKNDFITHTMALIKKMVKFGYEKRKGMRKVQSFRHFPRNLGRWSRIRQKIMETFNDWYNAINAEHR